jgi:hypothetical protein
MRIPLVLERQLPSRDQAYPIAPQEWRFRQSVDYSISFNRAVIDYAARNREHLLYNIYKMGRRSIERGSRDAWTPSPTRYAAAAGKTGGGDPSAERDARMWAELHKPEHRDPRGYILPTDQPDFLTAIKFINALREVNVAVHRATAEFSIPSGSRGPTPARSRSPAPSALPFSGSLGPQALATRKYPAGSFVVFTAQAFRPHVLDMFEPQDHPNVISYPGAPPTPPYDNAGWTLALQMGVQFDRILEPFTGPLERVTDWNVKPPPGRVMPGTDSAGYLLSRQINDAAVAVNRLLAAGDDVWLDDRGFFVRTKSGTAERVQQIAKQLGVDFRAAPTGASYGSKLSAPRIGLWDQYGGSMTSGWTRWILEQFEFTFGRVFAPQLDAGALDAKYDVLVFPNGGIPSAQAGRRGGRGGRAPAEPDVPAEYRAQIGRVSVERTIPQLKQFLEAGGTVVAIGESAANLAEQLDLPVADHLVEDGKPLPRARYFVPGSLLAARIDASHPIASGMPDRADFFFDNSPVFKLAPDAAARGVRAIAWFDSPSPLRSGWAWGQEHLDRGVIAVDAPVGKGRVLLFGPEILQRAQPHGTFKLLFNALYQSTVR